MSGRDLKYWYILSQTRVTYANKLLYNPLNRHWTENQEVCVLLFAADSREAVLFSYPYKAHAPTHPHQD